MTDIYDPERIDPESEDFFPYSQEVVEAALGSYIDELTLADMTELVVENNVAKGFRALDMSFGEYIALLHSEVSEALEAFRTIGLAERTRKDHAINGGPGKPDDVGSELADVLIRLLDTADVFGIDLSREFVRKHSYNVTRPHLHGKAF